MKCCLKECNKEWYKECMWEYLCKEHYKTKNMIVNTIPYITIAIFIIIFMCFMLR